MDTRRKRTFMYAVLCLVIAAGMILYNLISYLGSSIYMQYWSGSTFNVRMIKLTEPVTHQINADESEKFVVTCAYISGELNIAILDPYNEVIFKVEDVSDDFEETVDITMSGVYTVAVGGERAAGVVSFARESD